jgi:hypothetical protein
MDAWLPWGTVISQLVARWVFSMTLAGNFALSQAIVRFAVG